MLCHRFSWVYTKPTLERCFAFDVRLNSNVNIFIMNEQHVRQNYFVSFSSLCEDCTFCFSFGLDQILVGKLSFEGCSRSVILWIKTGTRTNTSKVIQQEKVTHLHNSTPPLTTSTEIVGATSLYHMGFLFSIIWYCH